jgi:hypothetical protein
MKTIMKNKLSVLFSALVLVALSSCGKVPSAYQGTYLDQVSGAKLELNGQEGKFTEATGREITAKAESAQFDALSQAKAGLYTRSVAGKDKTMEFFWVIPAVASRGENSGWVWFTAEVLYTRMETNANDPVPTLTVTHCTNGQLSLDMTTKTWNGSCGPDTVPAIFTRVKQ